MKKNEKLPMHTPSLADENLAALAKLFPNAVTETVDENGAVVRAIDADVLAQEINTHVVSGREERYQFTWPDKKKSILLANAPIAAALRPCREESVDFDNTENLYIEGDNLDVLKLLRETYLNRVKMIYIDPPYNTGNDFVYEDDFTEETGDFLHRDGQYDKQGNRLITNLDSNGRFHTDWLNMMYPRLRVARDLLTEDGVIFISIDDNEIHNLRKICDEIFGESNFIAEIIREAIRGGSQSKDIRRVHDYVLCYSKNYTSTSFSGFKKDELQFDLEDEKGKYAKGRELNKWGAGSRREDAPGMWFPIEGPNGEDVYPIRNDGTDGRWRLGKKKMRKKVADGDVIFEPRGDGTYIVYEKIRESKGGVKQLTTLFLRQYVNSRGTENIKKTFKVERALFDYSKPLELIHDLSILVDVKENDIVLDFFSGSATTAHAVMQLNAADGGMRKFIMVQLPEETDEKSEAYKAGYKNICEIGKERIRRAGKKIKEENKDKPGIEKLDIGFRVLKLDSSNMKDVYYTPEEYAQMNFDLDGFMDNIKPDRSDEDLLFQVMLDLGIPLSAKIRQDGKAFYVDDNYLIACFGRVDTALITEIAKKQPYYAVFRDSSFISDSTMVNFEQVFSTYSPQTIRRVL